MKMITLEETERALLDLRFEIHLEESIRVRAEKALLRMFEIGG
jgi:quinolinate synthase